MAMADPRLYDSEMFVVLETDQPDCFLSAEELLAKLKSELSGVQTALPPDLQGLATLDEQAQKLLKTACEFDLGPDRYLQWYAVRLEK
jgi:hypothetical protein